MGNKANFSITPDKAHTVGRDTNELQIFESQEFGQIRMVQLNNEPYFCMADICKALELSQPSKVKERLNKKGVNSIPTLTNGGTQNLLYINEANLYKTIFQSRKESAERFTDWVTSEVLPSIRKNGGYIAGQETLSDDELLAKAFVVAKNKIAERDKRIKALEQETIEMNKTISQMQPKVNYVDVVLQSKSTVCTTQIAQDYGMSAKAFNKILKNLEIQRKVGDQWILYAKYQGKGYVHSDTVNITRTNGQPDVKMNTKWTQKGRLFLYEKLKENGYIPLIEVNVA